PAADRDRRPVPDRAPVPRPSQRAVPGGGDGAGAGGRARGRPHRTVPDGRRHRRTGVRTLVLTVARRARPAHDPRGLPDSVSVPLPSSADLARRTVVPRPTATWTSGRAPLRDGRTPVHTSTPQHRQTRRLSGRARWAAQAVVLGLVLAGTT